MPPRAPVQEPDETTPREHAAGRGPRWMRGLVPLMVCFGGLTLAFAGPGLAATGHGALALASAVVGIAAAAGGVMGLARG